MTRQSTLPAGPQALGLLVWLAITALAAALGAVATTNAASFYVALEQPPWAPPAGVFGPVWTALYVLMAVAAWLVWRIDGFSAARPALALYLAQLVLNALWSWLFFAWHLGAAAFAELIALWLMVVATTFMFGRVRALAGALLVPYVLWVVFAAALNYAIWQMNPDSLG